MAAGLAWSGSSLAPPDLYPQPESCDRTPPSRVRTSDYPRTVTILSIKSRQIPVIFLYRVVIYVDRVTTCAWPTSIHRRFIQKTGQWRPVHMIYLVSGQVPPPPSSHQRVAGQDWHLVIGGGKGAALVGKHLHQRDIEPMPFYCCPSVVDGGPALKQHWVNVSSLPGHLLRPGTSPIHLYYIKISANTRHSPNAGSMLCQRRSRWHNIAPTLDESACLLWV